MRKVVKRVVLASNRSERAHYAVECAQNGRLSYVLCRGFPSIGAHQRIPESEVGRECKQCAKTLEKMLRLQGDRFILTTVGGEKHDGDEEV